MQQGIKGIGIEQALARTAVLRIGIEISHGFIGGGGQAGHFLPKAVNLRLGADIALPAMLGINGQLVEGQTVIGLGTVIPPSRWPTPFEYRTSGRHAGQGRPWLPVRFTWGSNPDQVQMPPAKNDLFAHGGVSVEHVGVERFILVIVIPVAQRYLWNLINYLLRDHSGGIVVIVDFWSPGGRTCRST